MKLKFIVTILAVLYLSVMNAQCPVGALTLTSSVSTINNGQTYCASSNVTLNGNFSIQPGGKLIITKGVKVSGSGSFTINGDLIIQDKGGLQFFGGVSLGFNPNTTTRIQLGKNAYLSINGALVQYDVSSGGTNTHTAQIEMDDYSVVEVCATYTHTSQAYRAVKYVGNSTAKAYFITKSSASGGGAGSLLSNESQINWIAMSGVDLSSLKRGNATYCGQNATSSTCPSIWPVGLTNAFTCSQAKDITDNLPQPCNIDSPTITITPATCSSSGTATVSNYNPSYTYIFSPTGPTVGAGGVISGMATGTNYTTTSKIAGCTSVASTSFSISAMLTCSVPFTCDIKFYLTQHGPAATDKTILYRLDNTTNPFTKTIIGESPAGMSVNGIGYNTSNNFIYGMRTDIANATHMVKIDANGVFTDLGAVTNLPGGGFNAGGFDNAGNYYIISFDSNKFYKINVTTNTATLVPLSRSLKVNDIAFDRTTSLFYGYEQSTGQLVSINTSGVVSNVGSPSALGNVYIGAMYSDYNGDIFGNEDNGSGFYQFDKATGQVVKISESISAFGNDGANCSNAIITFPADLSITKTDSKTTYVPGTSNTYTIVVSNNGPYGVLGATVSDPVPAGIPAANVSYSIPVATGGATTGITGSQTGGLNDIVGIPVGATITYTITVNVPVTFTGNLINTVTVIPPANSTDPDTTNNAATDTDTLGYCTKPGNFSIDGIPTKVGITNQSKLARWPESVPNGHITLESKDKGFVITRVNNTADVTDPREGMLLYDITAKCVKLYNGTVWKCIQRSCNN